MSCKWCNGTGTIPAGWNYLAHKCTDCDGTGEEMEWDYCYECNEEFMKRCTWQDTCEECMEPLGESDQSQEVE